MRKITTPPSCHPDRPYYSKNLCEPCYQAQDKWPSTLEQRRRWNKTYHDRHPNARRDSWLWTSYRIRASDYDEILHRQEGHCFFCDATESSKGRPLVVDHDHKTGLVRALLCDKHNIFIGALEQNLELLNDALDYISQAVSSKDDS